VAESPEEDREGRPAADGAGRDVVEVVDESDEARPEIRLLVVEEGTLEAGAEVRPDDVNIRREEEGGHEERGQEGSGGWGHFLLSSW